MVKKSPRPREDRLAIRLSVHQFLEAVDGPLLAFHDLDADGCAAAAVWKKTLEQRGFTTELCCPGRSRDPYQRSVAGFAAVFLLDLGNRARVPWQTPTCIIDHHLPVAIEDHQLLCNGSQRDPIPSTSLLVHELLEGDQETEWLAAVGALSDLGDKAPFELVQRARKRYTLKWLKEVVVLVNSARRASPSCPELAVEALLTYDDPKTLVQAQHDEVVVALHQARSQVHQEMTGAKRAAPQFSDRLALIEIASVCEIQPLIAQIWRGRLPKYFVLVANRQKEEVALSARARRGDLLSWLQQFEPSLTGHRQAVGFRLSHQAWSSLRQRLGFEP